MRDRLKIEVKASANSTVQFLRAWSGIFFLIQSSCLAGVNSPQDSVHVSYFVKLIGITHCRMRFREDGFVKLHLCTISRLQTCCGSLWNSEGRKINGTAAHLVWRKSLKQTAQSAFSLSGDLWALHKSAWTSMSYNSLWLSGGFK